MRLESLFDLHDRVALVTGGSSGIGFTMAKALGLAGASVVLASRTAETLQARVQELRDNIIPAASVCGDVSNLEKIEELAEQAVACFGKIDILVNAAGVNLRESFQSVSPATWDQQVRVHLG
ncbi:MAG: SDR family NAD(P)-dependent oxidoreductase, partial [Betaproteobacteria bacterium]|nr:SDR family NAD(P)-dependent oxidoreductase [Betaproteobacteria bacterium]